MAWLHSFPREREGRQKQEKRIKEMEENPKVLHDLSKGENNGDVSGEGGLGSMKASTTIRS